MRLLMRPELLLGYLDMRQRTLRPNG
jgi:hypothetical protein